MIRLSKCRQATVGFVALMLAVAAAIYVAAKSVNAPPPAMEHKRIEALLDMPLSDIRGAPRSLAEWRGKTLVIHFWSDGCEPCREDMPMLSALQRQFASNNVQVIGIGIGDAKNLAESSSRLALDYPLLAAGTEAGSLMRQLGNPTLFLPFTVVLDNKGEVLLAHAGRPAEKQLAAMLPPAKLVE